MESVEMEGSSQAAGAKDEKRRADLESWDATAENIARYYATLRANGVLDDAAQWLTSEFQQRYLSSLGMSDPT